MQRFNTSNAKRLIVWICIWFEVHSKLLWNVFMVLREIDQEGEMDDAINQNINNVDNKDDI